MSKELEFIDNAASCYKKAYDLTMLSVELIDADNKPTLTQLKLHKLFMQLNPYTLMTPASIDKVHELLIEEGLKNFFTRISSRFQFIFDAENGTYSNFRLYSSIWKACNIHDPIIKVSPALNKLGDENAEQQLTHDQGVSLLAYNRWYAMVCLFVLMYSGSWIHGK